jgi:hypothetical protein
MIDPLVSKAIALGFAALFLLSSWHKLGDPARFAASLADYRMLPPALVAPASRLLPIVEALTGAAWLFSQSAQAAALASVALLLAYTLAIGINLLRGRVHIGCGCGMTDEAAERPLSPALVVRNGVLIAFAMTAMLPVTERAWHFVDYLNLAAVLTAATLLYLGTAQLLSNHAAIASWRISRD